MKTIDVPMSALGLILGLLAVILISMTSSCQGSAQVGYSATSFSGPGGTVCFVILAGSQPVGGNCK